MAEDFRNNRILQQFVLLDVTPTGRVLGNGSYGSVEEVSGRLYNVAIATLLYHLKIHNLEVPSFTKSFDSSLNLYYAI